MNMVLMRMRDEAIGFIHGTKSAFLVHVLPGHRTSRTRQQNSMLVAYSTFAQFGRRHVFDDHIRHQVASNLCTSEQFCASNGFSRALRLRPREKLEFGATTSVS